MRTYLLPLLIAAACVVPSHADPVTTPPSGTYHTSWIGNSFGGGDGPNGAGEWVQDGVAQIAVSPDGTVIAGTGWDEAGRCLGLYKNGRTNHILVRAEASPAKAWGWNTGTEAIAISGAQIFDANDGKGLLRFSWNPGDIESVVYAGETPLPAAALSLAARGDTLAVVYADAIELRAAADFSVTSRFPITGSHGVAIAPDGSLWVLAGNAVEHLDIHGAGLGESLPSLVRPTALSWDNRGHLMVCDDGPEQVLTFDVTGAPKLIAAFGVKGGLMSGTPGHIAPLKLFGLRGASIDAAGNIYVAMTLAQGPQGGFWLRAFSPSGKLLWELVNASFVDTFGFLPGSDGESVYGRTTRWSLDLSRTSPGSEAKLDAITLDPASGPGDDRLNNGASVIPRTVGGRRVVYTIGQTAGSVRIYTLANGKGAAGSEILTQADQTPTGDFWAWDIGESGDIWNGDGPGGTVRLYRCGGIGAAGKPIYDWTHPTTWPWPADFQRVTRCIYAPATDSLYLFGYLKDQTVETWGTVGFTARRIDGWLSGTMTVRWTNTALPASADALGPGKPLTAKSAALAGDYLFLGMVRGDKPYTHILRISDGAYAGTFIPGPEVGGNAGWQDMPYSVQATRRKNGEYLILAEEDWRGKNLLYRWRP